MPVRLGRQFFVRMREDGLSTAIRATKRYLSNPDNLRLLFLVLRSRSSTAVRTVNGNEMELDIRPWSPNPVDKTLALDGVWDPGTTQVFRDVLVELGAERDSTIHVFDVGANIGYYVLLEADVLGSQARIYAIEPEPDNVAKLTRNVELNDHAGIDVLQAAVSDERSTLRLNLHSASTHHWVSDVPYDGTAERSIDVDAYPLDDLVEEKGIPSDELIVVRMDVQGHEDRAFDGMTRFLRSGRPAYVSVALHARDHDPRDRVLDALEEHGFEPEYVSAGGDSTSIRSYDDVPDGGVNLVASRV